MNAAKIYQMMLEDGVTPVYPVTHAKALAGLFTELNSWQGSTSITSLGTITTGTWHGDALENLYIRYPYVTIGGKRVDLGTSASLTEIGVPAWAQKAVMDFADLPSMYIGATPVHSDNTVAQALSGITTAQMKEQLTVGSDYPFTGTPGTSDGNGSHRRIYFGGTQFYLELDNNGYLHTNANFYADGWVTGGGIGSSGSGSGGDYVSYEEVQTLTAAQKLTARTNIGTPTIVPLNNKSELPANPDTNTIYLIKES